MNIFHALRSFVLLALVVTLSACGFHLLNSIGNNRLNTWIDALGHVFPNNRGFQALERFWCLREKITVCSVDGR